MARARDPNRDKAFEIYKENNGEITNRAIAETLDVLEKTISAWKSRDKWVRQLNGDECSTTNQKCSTTKKTTNKKNKQSAVNEQPIDVEMVVEAASEITNENAELTNTQRDFCLLYMKYLNATKAYQKAYNSSYETANTAGPRLLVNVRIRNEVARLKKVRAAGLMLDGNDVLQKYIDIAFADIGDYVDYGTEEVPLLDEEGLQLVDENDVPRTYQRSYVRLKDGAALDNTIVSEVKQGKDGVSVKLHDKMKALDVLAKYTDLLDERTKTNLQNEKSKVELIRAELDKEHVMDERRMKLEQMQLNIEKTKVEITNLDKDRDKSVRVVIVDDV